MSANTYLTPSERAVLEAARVGIAGAGGLGSNCAMHLVRAGVRHLTVVDFDVVNESNLNRQFFFRDQLGLKKVEALKANLLRIDPGADNAVELVDMAVEKGIYGFKVIRGAEKPVDPNALKAYRRMAEHGKPITFHTGILWDGRDSSDYFRPANWEGLLDAPHLRFAPAHARDAR